MYRLHKPYRVIEPDVSLLISEVNHKIRREVIMPKGKNIVLALLHQGMFVVLNAACQVMKTHPEIECHAQYPGDKEIKWPY